MAAVRAVTAETERGVVGPLADDMVLQDRYRLEERLGRGGMATVWRARDLRLDRLVAVKAPSDALASDPAYVARFEREAQIAAGLSHPNLVAVYDYGTHGGRPFLVMELIDGPTLAQRFEAGDWDAASRLAQELLGALHHIHRAGIVHRDVKPSNVLVGGDGRTRLTDFGIARPRDATSLTQTGLVLGTPRFLAPEVLRGEPSGERSDLYSAGVLLRQALTGSDGPPLTLLVDRLTAEDPAERPPSAAAALALLDDVTPPSSPRAPSAAPPLAPRRAPAIPSMPPGGRRTRFGPATVPTRARAGVGAGAARGGGGGALRGEWGRGRSARGAAWLAAVALVALIIALAARGGSSSSPARGGGPPPPNAPLNRDLDALAHAIQQAKGR